MYFLKFFLKLKKKIPLKKGKFYHSSKQSEVVNMYIFYLHIIFYKLELN